MTAEELSPIPEWIFADPMAIVLLKTIINRPRKSLETYASAHVVDNQIISIGRNMQVRREEGWSVIQGYANHAEMMAFSVGKLVLPNLTGGIIYVIGLLANDNIFVRKTINGVKKERFTCQKCAKKMCEHQLEGVMIPNAGGWVYLSSEEALKTAEEFSVSSKNNKDKRQSEVIRFSRKSFKQLSELLLATSSKQIIAQLEDNYSLHPLVADMLSLAKNGYISTKTYKQAVFEYLLTRK